MGFFEEHLADGRVRIGETATCCHCNGVVEIRDNMGKHVELAGCGMCKKPVCGTCHAHGKCTPFERRLDRIESRDRFLRSAGLIR